MHLKPIVLRATAQLDFDAAFESYFFRAGIDVAEALLDSFQEACSHIARHPATGSPRYGALMNIPGLRSWTLNRDPYLIFYFDRPDHVDVVRILHGAMDIPERLDS